MGTGRSSRTVPMRIGAAAVSKAFALKIALLQVLVDAWFARDCPKPHPENDPWKR